MRGVTGLELRRDEVEELRRLVGAAKRGRLGWQDEARLRHLLSKEQPDAVRFRWDELVEAGLLVLGVHFLVRQLEEGAPGLAPA